MSLFRRLDISRLRKEADRFAHRLDRLQKSLGPVPFSWYPYQPLTTFCHLDTLLTGRNRDLANLAKDGPILDLGCGDASVSLFFEKLGFDVLGVDHARSNRNSMAGARTLAEKLNSRVQLLDVDIDEDLRLPRSDFSLTLFFGVLYHLKNPFAVLQKLSRVTRWCLMSTRIARQLPGGTPLPPEAPLAYLLDPYELNQDDTNYWIFTEPALRRLILRTGWEIHDFTTVGATADSDPVSRERDERAFCLIRSRWGLANVALESGWHLVEENGWRWTAREFAIRVDKDPAPAGLRLTMRVFVPPALIERFGPVQLAIAVNGRPIKPEALLQAGEMWIRRDCSFPAVDGRLDFCLSHALPPGDSDARELGIVVGSIDVA